MAERFPGFEGLAKKANSGQYVFDVRLLAQILTNCLYAQAVGTIQGIKNLLRKTSDRRDDHVALGVKFRGSRFHSYGLRNASSEQ